jgi:hypothetical protein
VTKLSLLIGASTRSQLRWARQHIYSWLILGPVVVGLAYATAARSADNLPPWRPPRALLAGVAALVGAGLLGLSLSRATAEVYHLRRPEAALEALPVPASAHLHAALAARLARTLGAAAVILAAVSLFASEELFGWARLLPLAAWVMLMALSEAFAAINWIHWGHTKNKAAAVAALAAILLSVAVAGLLVALVIEPGMLGQAGGLALTGAGVLLAAGLYVSVVKSHAAWRVPDIEYARRLDRVSRRSVFNISLLGRRFNPVAASQLARDLQLTLRAFSSAVYVIAAVTALCLVVLLVALATDLIPPPVGELDWGDGTSWLIAMRLPQTSAIKIASAITTTSLAALLPVLVAYELPHLWLERATGTIGLDIWQAKLWYTRLVSLPAPVAAWVVGVTFGEVPPFYWLPLLAECALLWWAISSLIGALSFEMPNQPGLSIIVMVMMGGGVGIAAALGLLTSLLLVLGLGLYGQVMHSLTARGRSRVRYYLMTGGD